MKRISGGQLSRKAKATLLSSHAGGPRGATGDTSFAGQAKRSTQHSRVSPPPAREPTAAVGRHRPVQSDFDSDSTPTLRFRSSSRPSNNGLAAGQQWSDTGEVSDERVAVVLRTYAALGAGDWNAAFELADSEVELVAAEQSPLAGTYRGHEGVREFFRRGFLIWGGSDFFPEP